ncbi:hypothetical protein [Crossiella sp. CA198]|uniref:hypothetical protein n=1 Tax=Crossiella sp. CA198 TaxID=3455607 RepID=UPI003F8D6084
MIDVERVLERWGEAGVMTLISLGPGGRWRLNQSGSSAWWEGTTLPECFAGLAEDVGGSLDVELIMAELADRGWQVLLKFDAERPKDKWTFVVNGTEPGQAVRVDAATMERAIAVVLRTLRTQPGDWAWTAELS